MGRLVILGGGESGVGTAILGKQKGFEVFVSDKGEIQEKYKEVLEHFEIEWESGEHTEAKILNADLVMKSPGIPDSVPLVKALVEKGVPVISEIEFASKYTDATLIGITGSNGKTTTTMLTYHLLKNGGLNVGMAGNIGDSYAKMVAEKDFDHYVLEISSFQLDGIVDFKPHIAMITNITPDHLDRYEYKFENYIASKCRIAMNQDANDYLIYDADDDVIREVLKKHPIQSKLVPFSVKQKLEEGAWLEDKTIKIKLEHKTLEMSEDILALEGQHNVKNTMAASMAAMLVKVRKEAIRDSIQSFQGVPHRLEKVLKINHVEYINDSKATNVNATYYALDGIKKPIVWIVGGVDKGNDYAELMPLVREKVKAIVCLGADNSKLIDAFGNVIDLMVETYSMQEAVKVAYKIAERGDAVLLSPACASFDLFKNYEDRGDQFKNAVKNL
ncbi:MAG: UDP-N-acetylmuramoyl-L-alanine--D-glutamate ligase [Muricauda sp.]|jgi:UDP-N-acetylmuramoylalanine--D-glutamate ligase|nr:UDP-N-acetylmuramoyl-L-alanine--D-glutamate ligase [Allomuricauda sp.]MBO6533516.1 UDP-N-acetylmuramoyl-L-alanine--D-glutamate ligase [Allomuricauda sp.]MBO6589493.1 UDP-N-acetylmuramoyl-L-alanine--D-glutamate ligase [Allomuricauda sp.]MBO6619075.1 UDP-N-acetylmuramoyl-L-alanine--D-glutamate ligase [Allomuricauda sp.]MBO6645029.1 UDP-N-acetylmuramoyl-L-alanine--D-glutamate ligase [Allomuricauda sp.]MBO6747196.1 UDP-N-acetylmuramoyl-L-alanine--D-glutamate ligase [Allomuricauda sp.]